MNIIQNQPKEGFPSSPNMKLYTWALSEWLKEILDLWWISQLPVNVVQDSHESSQQIIFVRHLESAYNDYKNWIESLPIYKEFLLEEDKDKKIKLAEQMIEQFQEKVWWDYRTHLSQNWHQQWEELSSYFAEYYHNNPWEFPRYIMVSPYLRTRLTSWYILKQIQWLDLNIDLLTKDYETLPDMICGSFWGEDVVLKFDDRIRERDFGTFNAPSFLRKFYNDLSNPSSSQNTNRTQRLWQDYFTNASFWWESQQNVNVRVKQFLESCSKKSIKQILVVSHHLAIIAAVQSVFSGSIYMYQALDTYRKPKNWSLTVFEQIKKTQKWRTDRIRVWSYNLQLSRLPV